MLSTLVVMFSCHRRMESLTLPLRAYQVKKFRVAKNQPELEQCFRNESYLMQQLQHENLVRCYAVCDKRSDGSDAALLALVLELMVRRHERLSTLTDMQQPLPDSSS